jgi:hypothetical protein
VEKPAEGCLKSEFHHLEFICCIETPLILNLFHASLCASHCCAQLRVNTRAAEFWQRWRACTRADDGGNRSQCTTWASGLHSVLAHVGVAGVDKGPVASGVVGLGGLDDLFEVGDVGVHRGELARRVLGWPKMCKLAHAFLWEYS